MISEGRGSGGGMFSEESMSTISRDENVVLSSEDSSCPDESDIELGLGLSLGVRDSARKIQKVANVVQFGKILTAADFPSSISSHSSLSSSTSSVCSSSSLRGVNFTDGSNRNSDSAATINGGRY